MTRRLSVVFCLFAAAAMAQTREQAVAAARDGRVEEGITMLRSLMAAGDSSPQTAYDLALILTWGKHPREATDLFEQTSGTKPSEYVLLAMTRAYWDQLRYPEAQALASRGLAAFPANQAWNKLFALISGEAAERSGDLYSALRYYGDARRWIPDDVDLNKATAGVLARLGAPFAAASILPGTDLGLEAQKAGLMVRWGEQLRPLEPELRFQGTDAALARLNTLIAAASATQPQDGGLLTKLRRDRVVALRNRERWASAVEQADELRRGGDILPPYVRRAEADALLALRRPGEARLAYDEVIKASPKNQEALRGRFFAEVEEEDFRAAFATIDALATNHKPVGQTNDDPATRGNPDWLGDQITAAQARNYAGMNAESWRRLEELAQQVPGLGYLRNALGAVANARGWPRHAAEEVEIASTLAPQDVGVQISMADSRLWLHEYAQARDRADDLTVSYPENQAVRRLAQDVKAAYSWDFETESQGYWESRGNADSPGSGFNNVNRIYSPLLGDHWRLVGGFDYANARPEEGFVERYREGGGIEWRQSFFTIEADGWANTGTLHRAGASLSTDWKATDHWNFEGSAELFSIDTPLRAVLHGITANKVGFGAGYDLHESSGFGANLAVLDFSDGNRRWTGGFHYVQKLVNRPHFNLTARPEIYASANSNPNAPYFNPSRDFSLYAGVDADHILWRRYERSFRQHISVGAGTYWQRGFDTSPIAGVTYEQIYEFNPVTDLHYGVTYARRVYDGGPVNSLTLSIGLTQRF